MIQKLFRKNTNLICSLTATHTNGYWQ